jgi:hypothetical protein
MWLGGTYSQHAVSTYLSYYLNISGVKQNDYMVDYSQLAERGQQLVLDVPKLG